MMLTLIVSLTLNTETIKAQCLIDTSYVYEFIPGTDLIKDETRVTYSYDETESPIEIINAEYVEVIEDYRNKSRLVVEKSGNTVSNITQTWLKFDRVWRNQSKIDETYDNNGNMLTRNFYDWQFHEESWEIQREESFDYDAYNNPIEKTWHYQRTSSFDNKTTEYNFKDVMYYNEENLLILKETYQLDHNNEWRFHSYIEYNYIFHQDQPYLSQWLYITAQDQYEDGEKFSYTFDDNNRLISVHKKVWDISYSGWINDSRELYTYDDFGNVTYKEAYDFRFFGMIEALASREYFEYEGQDLKVHEIYHYDIEEEEEVEIYHSRTENICAVPTSTQFADFYDLYNVFPNPASNSYFNIETPEVIDYTIFNFMGQVVNDGHLNIGVNQISTSEIQSGIYLLKIGNRSTKIMIQ